MCMTSPRGSQSCFGCSSNSLPMSLYVSPTYFKFSENADLDVPEYTYSDQRTHNIFKRWHIQWDWKVTTVETPSTRTLGTKIPFYQNSQWTKNKSHNLCDHDRRLEPLMLEHTEMNRDLLVTYVKRIAIVAIDTTMTRSISSTVELTFGGRFKIPSWESKSTRH